MMNKSYKIIFSILVSLFLIVLALLIYDIYNNKDKSIKLIKHDVVDKLYKKVKSNDTVDDKKYISKLYGYSSDVNETIYLNVREGYILNNQVYDLDNNVIGDYSKDTINSLLDKATMKVYEFNKKSGNYTLKENEESSN